MCTRIVLLSCLMACATSQSGGAPEHVVESGGDAPVSQLPEHVVQRTDHEFHVYAQVEVSADAQLAAAEAAADTLARSELLKAVRVAVSDALSAPETHGSAAEISVASANAVGGVAKDVIPGLPAPTHAWKKLQRSGQTLLRVVAVLSVPHAAVKEAIAKALQPHKNAAEFATHATDNIGR